MDNPILEIEDLHLRYGSVHAVRGFNLSMQPGEAVGLIGANGAGKTTTLLGLMGVIPVASGNIRFAGHSIVGKSIESIARLGIALVPEGRRIFGGFTVEENMRLGALGRENGETLESDLDWIHTLFPIVSEFAQRPAGQLSGGQQQQLAIARALISDPKILLLDEPSLGLAPTIVEGLFQALEKIRARGVTILIVEQRAQLAAQFADLTVVMRTGEVVLTLPGDSPAEADQLAAAYFGS